MTWGTWCSWAVATALASPRDQRLRAPHSGAGGRCGRAWGHGSPQTAPLVLQLYWEPGLWRGRPVRLSLSRLLPSARDGGLPRLCRAGPELPVALAGLSRGDCCAARRQKAPEGVWPPPSLVSGPAGGGGTSSLCFWEPSPHPTRARRATAAWTGCSQARLPALLSGAGLGGQKRWRGWGPKCMGRLGSRGRCMGANS